jgi:hypothetical protein
MPEVESCDHQSMYPCRGSDKQVQIRNAPADPLLIGFHQTKCGSHSFIDRDRQEPTLSGYCLRVAEADKC